MWHSFLTHGVVLEKLTKATGNFRECAEIPVEIPAEITGICRSFVQFLIFIVD